jgi:hypothetical protein
LIKTFNSTCAEPNIFLVLSFIRFRSRIGQSFNPDRPVFNNSTLNHGHPPIQPEQQMPPSADTRAYLTAWGGFTQPSNILHIYTYFYSKGIISRLVAITPDET